MTAAGPVTVLVHGVWMHGVVMELQRHYLADRGLDARCYSYSSVAPTLTENAVEAFGAEALVARGEEIVPLRRLVEGAEVAETAVWLCSDAASAITGAVIPVDGGMSAF